MNIQYSQTETHDIVVLGAGLTGLSFAYYYDGTVPVFEKNSKVGGLVRTIYVNGYKFDLAPHLLHLRSDFVKNLIFNTLGLHMEKHTRKAKIYFEKRLIDYPFELNLNALSDIVRDECLKGLSAVDSIERSDEKSLRLGSYRDYAIRAFGSGIANHYLLPYNRKVWDTDPDDLTCEWMRLLQTTRVEEIVRSSVQPSTGKSGYHAEFFYPTKNGIQELSEAFTKKLSCIHLNEEAYEIDTKNKIIHFVNGSQIKYKTLISTIPIKDLIFLTNLFELKRIAKELTNTCVYNINIVIKGRVPEGVHWIYFPQPEFEFFRINLPKNYFPDCTQNNEQIIGIEIASRNQNLDIEKMRKKVIKKISTLDIFKIYDIVFTHCIKIPVAYCIYDKRRTKIVKFLRVELDKLNIKSVGRYGQWKYSCMEDAILQGKVLALKMKGLR